MFAPIPSFRNLEPLKSFETISTLPPAKSPNSFVLYTLSIEIYSTMPVEKMSSETFFCSGLFEGIGS